MPVAEYFPYMGPNRRSDKPVVELQLKFSGGSFQHFPESASDIRDLLVSSGILAASDDFPQTPLDDGLREENYPAWYTSLLLQTALLFQNKAGHEVSFFSVEFDAERDLWIGLLEHEHCDVGMTAMKLALEVLSGQRKLLQEPFKAFSAFARERLLPLQTEAIIKAAQERDIPCVQLERSPFKRTDFDDLTNGNCVLANGLLMLGHGAKTQILDGTYCLNRAEYFADYCDVHSMQQELAWLTESDTENRAVAADHLLDWLFPDPANVRMPIIAVTGTNGKTTTCRMITHILSNSGHKPGLVCTDGIYVDGEILVEGDKSARTGHFRVLGNKDVDFAVLETHHLAILRDGFSFKECEVGICLNVTEDHIGVGGVESVKQMSEVKRALVERAGHAAILNADDPYCLSMTESISAARLCMVSMRDAASLMTRQFGHHDVCFSVLEQVEGVDWLVMYDGGQRIPVISARDIPATFDGTAGFNISNALHAVAACYLAGIGIGSIGAAMQSFRTSYETTPGRMNVYDELPFRVIVDFAHNPDGMRRLVEFTNRQNVEGRKLLAFSGSWDRPDESNRNLGMSVAGHFDFYFCKEYVPSKDRNPRPVAHILQQGLLDAGVSVEKTMVTTNGKEVIFEIFDTCKKGDLLVMLFGYVEMHQIAGYISEYLDKLNGHQPG